MEDAGLGFANEHRVAILLHPQNLYAGLGAYWHEPVPFPGGATPTPTANLLLEDATDLLLEDGSNILME
jgi:hypothetical protein